MTDAEYIDLCHQAKDALAELLDATDHDRGTKQRIAYRDLKRYIEKHEGGRDDEPESRSELDEIRERRARSRAWRQWPLERKEALVLEILGDERLTGKELAIRFRTAVAADFDACQDQVMYVVRKMLGTQVDRELEPWGSRGRYVYFAKRGLEGPIAELQAQLDATDAGGVA